MAATRGRLFTYQRNRPRLERRPLRPTNRRRGCGVDDLLGSGLCGGEGTWRGMFMLANDDLRSEGDYKKELRQAADALPVLTIVHLAPEYKLPELRTPGRFACPSSPSLLHFQLYLSWWLSSLRYPTSLVFLQWKSRPRPISGLRSQQHPTDPQARRPLLLLDLHLHTQRRIRDTDGTRAPLLLRTLPSKVGIPRPCRRFPFR